jgi:hypothetical protein
MGCLSKLLQDIVKNNCQLSDTVDEETKMNEVILFVLDTSGSTQEPFNKYTVLTKEISIVRDQALLNLEGQNHLMTFDNDVKYYGPLRKIGDNFMIDPNIRSSGGTMTAKMFPKIDELLKIVKINKVILVTDGQTHSSEIEMKNGYNKLKKNNIELEIIAVSSRNIDFQGLKTSEMSKVPGLDIVNFLNDVKSIIYTPLIENDPYHMSKKYSETSKTWLLLNVEIPKNLTVTGVIHEIINRLLLNSDADNLFDFHDDTEKNLLKNDMITLFCELGTLIAVVFVSFPEKLLLETFKVKELTELVQYELIEFMRYGFDSKRQKQQIVYINIQERFVDYVKRKSMYEEAGRLLNSYGSSLLNECISFSGGVVSFVTDPEFLELKNQYSIDKFGNCYFSLGTSEIVEQATRQSLRKYFGHLWGIRNIQDSFTIIFGMTVEILKILLCSSVSLDDFYIKKLRKISRTQVKMLRIVGKSEGKPLYGNSFLQYWKNGEIPTVSQSSTKTHMDLIHTDEFINPLNLDQTLLWATIMMILGEGCFEAQLFVYTDILNSLNIPLHSEGLLKYLRNTFSSNVYVSGTVNFSTFDSSKSKISGNPFKHDEIILKCHKHGHCPNTNYSRNERELLNKCIYCFKPSSELSYSLVEKPNDELLTNQNPCKFQTINETPLGTLFEPITTPSSSRSFASSSSNSSSYSSSISSSKSSQGYRTSSSSISSSSNPTKGKIVMIGTFGNKGKSYSDFSTRVLENIATNYAGSINANIMELPKNERKQLLKRALQLFKSNGGVLVYVGGIGDLSEKNGKYYFWNNIEIGLVQNIEVEFVKY